MLYFFRRANGTFYPITSITYWLVAKSSDILTEGEAILAIDVKNFYTHD